MRRRGSSWRVLGALVLLALVAACGSPGSGTGTQTGTGTAPAKPAERVLTEAEKEFQRTLVVASGLDITGLDPHTLTAMGGAVVNRNVYEPLVRYNGNSTEEMEGVLATSWEISPDGKVYTFNLRQGVKFHDGTDFNADAVKFSFDRLFALNKGPVNTFSMIDKVEVVDPFKVRFTLKYAFKPFLQVLGGLFGTQIISPQIMSKEINNDKAEGWMKLNAVGTGPYKLESVTPGDRAVLVKNGAYWGGWAGNHVERVILRQVREAATQKQLLERGEVDIAESIMVEDIPLLKGNKDIVVDTHPTFTSFYIYFHTQRGPLANKLVRQALSMAIDYDKIVNSAMGGFAKQSSGPLPAGMWGHNPNVKVYKRDIAAAKKLMAEAGYPNGGFELGYMYIGLEYQRVIGELLQSNWKDLGVGVKLQSVTVAAGRAQREKPETSPDMFIYYAIPRFADPDAMAFDIFSSMGQPPRGANWGWYKNERVDQILQQARISTDAYQRLALYKEFQDLVVEDAPAIFLMNTQENVIYRKWLKGVNFNMMYSRALYFYNMSKEL